MNLMQLEMAISRRTRAREPETPVASLVVEDTKAIAISPEGAKASMALDELLARAAAGHMGTGLTVLPDGIKGVLSQGPVTIWIWESPPRIYQFDWIANDSPAPFGKGTKYRKVRLALPYLVVLAVFARNEAGLADLLPKNECFFRTAPLKSFADELFYPALLNCSKFQPPEGRPLSWICTQHLRPTAMMKSADASERICAGFEALRLCLLESAFNHSSEHHEGSSWFSESRSVDHRIKTVEAWEQASVKDPLFVLEVPWLKTGHTLTQVTERIFTNLQAAKNRVQSAAGLARIIFNHAKS